MPAKKKKKGHRQRPSPAGNFKAEQDEEMMALEAIYGPDFVRDTDGHGFSLHIVPHPGQAEDNFVSVELAVRYPGAYPSHPVMLKVRSQQGLSTAVLKTLAQKLNALAAEHARQSEVCVFNLVSTASELLLEYNIKPPSSGSEDEEGQVPGKTGKAQEGSLWHEMQRRAAAATPHEDDELDGLGVEVLYDRLVSRGAAVAGQPGLTEGSLFQSSTNWSMQGGGLFTDDDTGMVVMGDMPPHSLPSVSPAGTAAAAAAAAVATSYTRQGRNGSQTQGQIPSDKAKLPRTAKHSKSNGRSQPKQSAFAVNNTKQPAHAENIEHSATAVDQALSESLSEQVTFVSQPLHHIPDPLQEGEDHGPDTESNMGQSETASQSSEVTQHQGDETESTQSTPGRRVPERIPRVLRSVLNGGPTQTIIAQQQHKPQGKQTLQLSSRIWQGGSSSDDESSEMSSADKWSATSTEAEESGTDTDSNSSIDQEEHGAGCPQSRASLKDHARREELRLHLLVGHLLSLLATQRASSMQSTHVNELSEESSEPNSHRSKTSVISEADSKRVAQQELSELVSFLRQNRLLPKWVAHMLVHQQGWLEMAFNKVFQKEVHEAARISTQHGTGNNEPSSSGHTETHTDQHSLLHKFWCGNSALVQGETDSSTTNRLAGKQPDEPSFEDTGSKAATAQKEQQSKSARQSDSQGTKTQQAVVSRYKSDFRDEQRLGKGGYGVVVSAINVLDGLKYAIKKIRMVGSPAGSSRITREVNLLSRLQHPNVVRYYQAWSEPLLAEDVSDDEDDDDEGGEWGALGRTPTGTDNTGNDTVSGVGGHKFAFGGTSMSIPPHLDGGLYPVKEERAKLPGSGDSDAGWAFESDPTSSAQRTASIDSTFAARGQEAAKHSLRSIKPRFTHMLYIQMEFCPRTLAQSLEAGPLPPDERWHVLRGICAGLAHIHSLGILHRDLKPANIFYDAKNDVKLGDFGLAKQLPSQQPQPGEGGQNANFTGSSPATAQPTVPVSGVGATEGLNKVLPPRPLALPTQVSSLPSERTGIIGTSYYIAPEIVDGWASYDEKVDLFSLGIVVFEMWHPFATAMERAVLLRDLRENGKVPAAWEKANPTIAKLIRWLMAARPQERPTAREVLTSGLLPPRVQDEQVDDLLRSLPDSTDTATRVLDALFKLGARKVQARHAAAAVNAGLQEADTTTPAAQHLSVLTAAAHELAGAPKTAHHAARELVKSAVAYAFSRHGAMPMISAQVGAAHAHLPPDTPQLLSRNGTLLSARRDLRLPFAAWLAQQAALSAASQRGTGRMGTADAPALDCVRRYEITTVMRQVRDQDLPVALLVADLDIISPHSSTTTSISSSAAGNTSGSGGGASSSYMAMKERLLTEAEAIRAVVSALEALPLFSSPAAGSSAFHSGVRLEVRLSHRALLDALTANLQVSKQQLEQVLAQMRTAIPFSPVAQPEERLNRWPAIQTALKGLQLLPSAQQHARMSLLQLPGEIYAARDRTELHLKDVYQKARAAGNTQLGSIIKAAQAALVELRDLAQYLTHLGIPSSCVVLDPLILPEADYFTQTLFSVHVLLPMLDSTTGAVTSSVSTPLQGPAAPSLQCVTLAAGGRYDSLLKAVWPPPSRSAWPAPGAVGVTVNLEKLISVVAAVTEAAAARRLLPTAQPASSPYGGAASAGGQVLPGLSCADVLVASRGDNLLELRLKVVSSCWAAGLRAEIMPKINPGMAEQYEFAATRGMKLLVVLDPAKLENSEGPLVKIKKVGGGGSKTDETIPLAELTRHLTTLLGSSATDAVTAAKPAIMLTSYSSGWSGAGAIAPGSTGINEVVALQADTQGKLSHVNAGVSPLHHAGPIGGRTDHREGGLEAQTLAYDSTLPLNRDLRAHRKHGHKGIY